MVESYAHPERNYNRNAPLAERRRVQAEVVSAYRALVSKHVRMMVPERFREEAEQVGAIGLLVALERYDVTKATAYGGDRGRAFWNYAKRFVRDEVRDWRDRGVFWRPRTRKVRTGHDEAQAQAHRLPLQMDFTVDQADTGVDANEWQVDHQTPLVDALAVEHELRGRLDAFIDTLNDEERAIVLSEDGRDHLSRRHRALVTRAAAFVRGTDGRVEDDLRGSSTRVRARPAGIAGRGRAAGDVE